MRLSTTTFLPEKQTLSATNRSRFGWIDYAKGFAIILVVYRHIIGGFSSEGLEIPLWLDMVQQSVYNIRMPLFFIIAGLFVRKSSEKRSFGNFFKHKLDTILYPYLIWVSIQLSFQIIFSDYSHAKRTIADFLYIFYNPFALEDQFWFLFVIFFVTLLFAALLYYAKVSPAKQLLLGIALNGLSLYVEIIPIKVIFEYYLFFALGDFVSRVLIRNNEKLSTVKALCIILPLFFLSQWFWVTNPDLKETQFVIFNIIAIIGSTFLLSLSLVLDRFDLLRWLKIIGKHSLYIYVLHVIVQAGMRVILMNFLHINSLSTLLPLSLVLSVILPVFFYKGSRKLGMWYFFHFRNPEAKPLPAAATSKTDFPPVTLLKAE